MRQSAVEVHTCVYALRLRPTLGGLAWPEVSAVEMLSVEHVTDLPSEPSTIRMVAMSPTFSVKTIEAHRANIMRKLHLRSVSDLVRYAIRNKIAQP